MVTLDMRGPYLSMRQGVSTSTETTVANSNILEDTWYWLDVSCNTTHIITELRTAPGGTLMTSGNRTKGPSKGQVGIHIYSDGLIDNFTVGY